MGMVIKGRRVGGGERAGDRDRERDGDRDEGMGMEGRREGGRGRE